MTEPEEPIEIEEPYDFGMRMPDTGPQLPANERTAIREWIRMGALGPGEVPVDAGPPVDADAPADAEPPPSDAPNDSGSPPADAEPPPADAEPPTADGG